MYKQAPFLLAGDSASSCKLQGTMRIPHYFRRIIFSFALISTFLWLYNSGGVPLQPKYNSFSCPGYLTPAIRSTGLGNRNATVNPPPSLKDRPILPDFSPSPFAYVFYATQPDYACSVLVNIDRLQNVFNTTHRIIVLVRPDLASSYLTAFTRLNATVIPYSPPELREEQIGYYHDVLLKLVAFRLHHYIPSLKRILVLDGDQLVLQSLDHVFHLPPVDVAAPRAYWGQEGTGFTSAFLLVTLSDRVWDRMMRELGAIKQNVFDMDLVNGMFKQTVLMLPGDYATLNSHWETNDIPSWWMGDTPAWPYTQLQLPKENVAPKKNMPPGQEVPEQPKSSENDALEEPDGDELYNGQPVAQQLPQPTQQQQAPQLEQASSQPQLSKQEQSLPQHQAPKQEQAPPQQAPPQQASPQQQASQKAESPQQPQAEIKQPTQPSQDNPKHPPEETSTHPSQQQTQHQPEETSTRPSQQQTQQPPQQQQSPSNSLSQPSQAPTQPTSETNPEPKIQRRSLITEEEAKNRAYEEDQLKKRREVYDAVLYEIYAAVKVLHFTALGKPWSWHIGDVEEARPFAHDLFKVQFETWQNASWRLCSPEWR